MKVIKHIGFTASPKPKKPKTIAPIRPTIRVRRSATPILTISIANSLLIFFLLCPPVPYG